MRPLSASNHGGRSARSSPRITSLLFAPVGSAKATLQYHFPRPAGLFARENVRERSGSSAHTLTLGVVRGRTSTRPSLPLGILTMNSHRFLAGKLVSHTA